MLVALLTILIDRVTLQFNWTLDTQLMTLKIVAAQARVGEISDAGAPQPRPCRLGGVDSEAGRGLLVQESEHDAIRVRPSNQLSG